MMPSRSEMSSYFQRLLTVLQCLYTQSPSKDERLLLEKLLYNQTDMTAREIAYIVGFVMQMEYSSLLNEVYEALRSDYTPVKEDYEILYNKLVTCCYGDWAAFSTKEVKDE
jgi:hypothetical protein